MQYNGQVSGEGCSEGFVGEWSLDAGIEKIKILRRKKKMDYIELRRVKNRKTGSQKGEAEREIERGGGIRKSKRERVLE